MLAGPDRIVVDTDSGVFGDDGAALVMLVRNKSSISGVTLVSGNVWSSNGAGYTSHILELVKQPWLSVYTGAAAPLVHTPAMAREAARRWGKQAFTGAFAEAAPAELKSLPGAIEFLTSEVRRHPGEVTVLAIGPLTNIALALKLEPEFETKIKRIVIMGGNVRAPGNASSKAEFNFWFDPEAARIVLRSRIPEKVMFPLDICNLAPVRKQEFDELVAVRTPITDLIREDLGNRYPGFLKNPNARSYMWDSLAAAWLIDPGFVTKTDKLYLDVDAAWGPAYGATVPLDRRVAPDATPVTVAFGLDLKRVWTLTRDLLTR